MKKRILSILLALCIMLVLLPTPTLATEEVTPASKLVYTEIIAPQYEDVRDFSEGLAAVKKDGKWGYIDTEGNVVIPFQFDDAGSFSEGRAVVCTLVEGESHQGQFDNEWYDCYQYGFIDKSGSLTNFTRPSTYFEEKTEKPIYYAKSRNTDDFPEIGQFCEGYVNLSWSWQGDWGYGLFDTDGKMITLEGNLWSDPDDPGGASSAYSEGKWPVTDGTTILFLDLPIEAIPHKYYNFATGETFKITYDVPEGMSLYRPLDLRPFNDGLAPVGIILQSDVEGIYDKCWGFVDKSGNWVIEPKYHRWIARGNDRAFFENGLAAVSIINDDRELFGMIDKNGKTAIDFNYTILFPFHEGSAAVCDPETKLMGYLDFGGDFVIFPSYKFAGPFGKAGFAIVSDSDEFSCYLIDKKGNKIKGSENLDLGKYWGEFGGYYGFGYWTPMGISETEYIVIRDRGEGRPSDEFYGITVYDNAKYGFGKVSEESTEPVPTPSVSPTPTEESTEPVPTPSVVPTPTPPTASDDDDNDDDDYTPPVSSSASSSSSNISSTSKPSPSPSATPTPSPTPSATPAPTPAPTPTPASVPASERFADVEAGSWYEAGVTFVTDKGLFNGMAEGEFAPGLNMTRAMLMTVLARLDGQDIAGGDPWYAKAMVWAKNASISDGTMPESSVTREQLVAMLYRYAKAAPGNGRLSGFMDGNTVSPWAVDAMTWAVAEGIITGTDWGGLYPQGTATRAEVAVLFQRFVEKIET